MVSLIISGIECVLIIGITIYLGRKVIVYHDKVNRLQDNLNIEYGNNLKLAETNKLLNDELEKAKSDREDFLVDASLKKMESLNQMHEEKSRVLDEAYQEKRDELKKKFEQDKNDYTQEYLEVIKDLTSSIEDKIKDKQDELSQINQEVEREREIVNLSVEMRKRAEEEQSKVDFYRLQLPHNDIQDIEILKPVADKLHTKEAIYKVIWKTYYEKPFNDLVGRVIGNTVKTGIYKITDIETGKAYVGQAVDIKNRWRSHIKRGMGAETPTRNKLYPAMLEKGVENFTFEIIEECKAAQLSEREKYWIDFLKTKEYGWNVVAGG